MNFRALTFILLFVSCQLTGQEKGANRKIDSLQKIFDAHASDTTGFKALIDIGRIYIKRNDSLNYESVKKKLTEIYEVKKDPVIGNWYFLFLSLYEEKITFDNEMWLKYLLRSAECCEKTNSKTMLARRLQRAGALEIRLGNFKDANMHLFKALRLNEEIGNELGMCYNYFAIGESFRILRNYPKALKMYREGFILAKKNNDYEGIVAGYTDIGIFHEELKVYDSASFYIHKALEYAISNNNPSDIAQSYDKLSGIYAQKKEYALAIQTAQKAIDIKLKIGNPRELAVSYIKLAEAYEDDNNYKEAEKIIDLAILYSRKTKDPIFLQACYRLKGFILRGQNKFQMSVESFLDYIQLHDSLILAKTGEETATLEAKYQNEKKEKEIQLLNKDKLIQEVDIKKQKQFSYFIIAIAVLLALTVFFIFRGLRQKHRDNKMLHEKNTIIERQKELVEEKQKEILDSIYYARRIQRAQIPSEKQIARTLGRLRK